MSVNGPSDHQQPLSDERTLIENDRTILENDRTIAEARGRAGAEPSAGTTTPQAFQSFRRYTVCEQLPSPGAEADIYIVQDAGTRYVLKLYRYGIVPNEDVMRRARELGTLYPDHVIRIIEYGYEDALSRWFEIQEYAVGGSLREYLKAKPDSSLLNAIISEITEGLHVIHSHNVLHLDLKLSNILVHGISPLNLVFGDFGISSFLDPELSQKMTTVKGTPLYWAPESFTGVVGKEADYWALGMMTLELLLGRHPFSGIDTNVIMYTLATKGVVIPEGILDEYELLLKGLLTRDPKQRWTYDQVSRWLRGERNILVYYSHEAEGRGKYRLPFVSRNREFFSIEDVVGSFIEDEDAWKEGTEHLVRGYLAKWLVKNDRYSDSVRIEQILKRCDPDIDLAMVRMIYTFNPELPFALFGKLITIQNIHGYLKHGVENCASDAERSVVDAVLSGSLRRYHDEYVLMTRQQDNALAEFLRTIDDMSLPEGYRSDRYARLCSLDAFLNPDKYVLPFSVRENAHNRMQYVCRNAQHLFSHEQFEQLKKTHIVPAFILRGLEGDGEKFTETLHLLSSLKARSLILERNELEQRTRDYLVPQGMIDGVYSEDFAEYADAIDVLRAAADSGALILKEEHSRLAAEFLIPGEVTESLSSREIEPFQKAVLTLKRLHARALLLQDAAVEKYCHEHPRAAIWLRTGELMAEKKYTDHEKQTIAKSLTIALASKMSVAQYARVSRFIQNSFDMEQLMTIDKLQTALSALHSGLVHSYDGFGAESMISTSAIHQYLESLKAGIIPWTGEDREILADLLGNLNNGMFMENLRCAFTSLASRMIIGGCIGMTLIWLALRLMGMNDVFANPGARLLLLFAVVLGVMVGWAGRRGWDTFDPVERFFSSIILAPITMLEKLLQRGSFAEVCENVYRRHVERINDAIAQYEAIRRSAENEEQV